MPLAMMVWAMSTDMTTALPTCGLTATHAMRQRLTMAVGVYFYTFRVPAAMMTDAWGSCWHRR